MTDCRTCKHVEWNYVEYYGIIYRDYFSYGCDLDLEPEECDEYEEETDE